MLKRRTHRWMATCALACSAILFFPRPASAKRDYLDRVMGFFGLNAQTTGKCVFCHAVNEKEKPGKGNLGLYGKEIKAAFESNDQLRIQPELAVAKSFEKDTDGDGILNREEIALGSFPGDKASVPPKEKLDQYRKGYAEAMRKRAAKK